MLTRESSSKLSPVTFTKVPAGPEFGIIAIIGGPEVTVKSR